MSELTEAPPPQADDWEDLLGLAALDALAPADREIVKTRLKTDEAARKTFAEYRQIAHLLVHTAPVLQAPSHLEEKLRQAVRADAAISANRARQVVSQPAPTLTKVASAAANGDTITSARRVTTPIPVIKSLPKTTNKPNPESGLLQFIKSFWLQPSRGLALASLLAVLAMGTVNYRLSQTIGLQQGELLLEQQRTALVNDILASPDLINVKIASADPASKASARLVCAPGKPGLFTVTGLPPTPPDRPYQLMLTRKENGVLDRVATFTVDGNGNASIVARAPIPWRQYTNALVTAADAAVILNGNF